MSLTWDTLRALPRLRTYKDAAEWEANVKPIKGDANNLKPVGRRSQKWRHIKKEADSTITIFNGPRPIMTFRPDDTVNVYGPTYWNKATEHDLIQEILGLEVWTEARASWVKCDGGKFKLRPANKPTWNADKQEWVYPEGKEHPDNLFKLVEVEHPGTYAYKSQVWTYLNPPKMVTHVIDRKGAKAVRERYAGYSQYLSAMMKLRRDSKPEFEEYLEAFPDVKETPARTGHSNFAYKPWWMLPSNPLHSGFDHNDASKLCKLMQSDKPEDQHRALLWLTSRNWGAGGAAKAMDRCLMMHHHDEMLKTKEYDEGHKAIDRYAWAIPKEG